MAGGIGNVVVSGTRGGPQIQYPMGQTSAFQGRLGGGLGLGLAAQRARAAKKPGSPDIPVPTDLTDLTQTQGGFNDPESMWAILNGYRQHGGGLGPLTTRARLGELSGAMANYGGPQRRTALGASATGFGDAGSFDPLRKLIQQRLGVGL